MDPKYDSFTCAVAWGRSGAITRLEGTLSVFSERGFTRAIIGLDEGGGTKPGLVAALDVFDEVYVYHATNLSTFHPKIYFARGPSHACLIVGSSNLTPGGLYSNHEASLVVEFSLPGDAREQALLGVETYIDSLLDDRNACIRLTHESLAEILNDSTLRIAETETRLPREERTSEDDDAAVATPAEQSRAFGASVFPRANIPPLHSKPKRHEVPASGRGTTSKSGTDSPSGLKGANVTAEDGAPAKQLVWKKQLSRTDAQQPPTPGTNPTGVMRLSQAGMDIDHRTWFRRALFRDLSWVRKEDSNKNPIETTEVVMRVLVDGEVVGEVPIVVDHAPHREAGQNNVPTVLHWGPMMLPLLRQNDFAGKTIAISLLSDGSYELEIA